MPTVELKEKVGRLIRSCHVNLDELHKKKTIYQFVETFAATVIASTLAAEPKTEGPKDYKEKVARIGQLESELQLRENTIQK